MRTKAVGRALRSWAPTARALTEFRVAQLARNPLFLDLELCRRHARPGTLAVDVGASVGNYALALSKAVGRRGHVLALEANPAVFGELERSTWGSRVTALNLAASSRNGTARMLVPHTGSGAAQEPLATLEERPGQPGSGFEVRCVRLDDLLPLSQVVSLIKIDVEGHEADVLAGAVDTLARHRPTIVAEIEDRHLGGRGVASVVEPLLADYDCHGISGEGLVPWADFDEDRDQRAHLSDGGADILDGHEARYVNNFVFAPRGQGA